MFDRIIRKRFSPEPQPEVPTAPTGPYLTRYVTFGMHLYRTRDEDSSVYFVDEARGIRKQIVDSRGCICSFPGIVEEDFWVRQVTPNALQPQICFRTSFTKRDDRFMMLWQIQPDGFYWADEDGFGAENDPEVTLYAFLDENGDFTGPFRIYQLNTTRYYQD